MTVRTGRPRNSGLDDGKLVEAAEAAVAAGLHPSERAAILAIAGGEESVVRRLQRKLQRRRQARDGDLDCLPDLGLTFGEPYLEAGFWIVPVGEHDGRELALAHCEHLDRPVMMRRVGGVMEIDLPRGSLPGHPVFRALDRLPSPMSWDDRGYRALCAIVGMDPDRGRPYIHPIYAEYLRDLAAGGPRENPFEARRSAFAPAGKGLHGCKLGLLASQLHRDGAWPDGPLACEVRAAEDRIDWRAAEGRGDFDLVRTPWTDPVHWDGIAIVPGPEYVGGCYLGMDPCRLMVMPEPACHDLGARAAARRVVERALGVVVTPEEAERLRWAPPAPSRNLAPWTATAEQRSVLAHAVASACDWHASRRGGPVPQGGPRDLFELPEGWRDEGWPVEWDRHPGRRTAGGRMSTPLWDLHLAPRGRLAALVTSGDAGLKCGDGRDGGPRYRFSCSFRLPHPQAPSAIPQVGAFFADFVAERVDDGSPMPPALLRTILATCMGPATALIRDHFEVEPEHDAERRRRGGPDCRVGARRPARIGERFAALGRRLAGR